ERTRWFASPSEENFRAKAYERRNIGTSSGQGATQEKCEDRFGGCSEAPTPSRRGARTHSRRGADRLCDLWFRRRLGARDREGCARVAAACPLSFQFQGRALEDDDGRRLRRDRRSPARSSQFRRTFRERKAAPPDRGYRAL